MSQAVVYTVGTCEGVPLNSGRVLYVLGEEFVMILLYLPIILVVLSSMLGGGFQMVFHSSLCSSSSVFIHFGVGVCNDCIILLICDSGLVFVHFMGSVL
jgi:hypothetical protein